MHRTINPIQLNDVICDHSCYAFVIVVYFLEKEKKMLNRILITETIKSELNQRLLHPDPVHIYLQVSPT